MKKIDERDHLIRRMEQANMDLRRRNGELYVALQAHDPDAAERLTPKGNWPTRYSIIDAAFDHLASFRATRDDDELALALECLDRSASYWDDMAHDTATRSERGKRLKADRTTNPA